MFLHLVRRALWIGLLPALLPAQRAFVVDASNGAGTNFTDLPAALAQAQHGDIYSIRPGTYSPAATDKGVALLGTTGVMLVGPLTSTVPALKVSGLVAGATFTLKRVSISAWSVSAVELSSCAGRVHLEGVQIARVIGDPQRALTITSCALVTLSGSTCTGGVACTDGTLAIARSSLIGSDPGSGPLQFSTSALALSDTRALLSDTTLRGGNGLVGGGTVRPSAPALSASASQVQVFASGAGKSRLDSGICTGGFCSAVTSASAVSLGGSVFIWSPQTTFATQFGVPAFYLDSGSTEYSLPLPSLVATGAARGGSLTTSLASQPGDPFALVLGMPADPVLLPSGLLCVDLATSVTLAMSLQGPSGLTTLVLPVPNNPSLVGITIAQQAASFTTSLQYLLFTNAEFTTID